MRKYIAIIMTVIPVLAFCACGFPTSAPAEIPPEASEPVQAELPAETPITTGNEAKQKSYGEPADVSASDEAWKAEFEASLLEQYGVVPERYEDMGEGWYQVYVIIEGRSVPYVAVDSATGYYHG